MIKKLRRKFVAVVMGASAFILLTVFLVLLFTTRSGLLQQSKEALTMALNNASRDGRFPKDLLLEDTLPDLPPDDTMGGSHQNDGYNNRDRFSRYPAFTALVEADGTVTLGEDAVFLEEELAAEEIEDLARSAAASQSPEGVLSAYRLRYAKQTTDKGTLVAFIDSSAESNAMAELIKNSLLIGAATLLVFLGASILLARWAVKPVEKAWMQQKQFVADASHELKTPLTVILSNADMLLSHPEEPPLKWTENIKAEAQRMKRLTEELLSLARSDDMERKPVLEQVDFSYLVTDSVLAFEPVAFEGGHSLIYNVKESLTVLGDPSALSQVCAILLENALKYGEAGGAVTVTLEQLGKTARLTVANPGEPLSPEEATKIFERFYRGDPSRHGDGGHGLGLSIARGVVENHKGKIWAESASGFNRFVVSLPLAKL